MPSMSIELSALEAIYIPTKSKGQLIRRLIFTSEEAVYNLVFALKESYNHMQCLHIRDHRQNEKK